LPTLRKRSRDLYMPSGSTGTIAFEREAAGAGFPSSSSSNTHPEAASIAISIHTFETTASAGGVTAPMLLNALGLRPADASGYGGDYIYMNNGAGLERLPWRGGSYPNTAGAGVFARYNNLIY